MLGPAMVNTVHVVMFTTPGEQALNVPRHVTQILEKSVGEAIKSRHGK